MATILRWDLDWDYSQKTKKPLGLAWGKDLWTYLWQKKSTSSFFRHLEMYLLMLLDFTVYLSHVSIFIIFFLKICRYSNVISSNTSAWSMIRVLLIQSCSSRAENFTNYLFCHPQFSGVIQNIENRCAIRAKFDCWLYKIDYFDNNRHRQTGVKMAQQFSIFWITPLNCGWQNT